MGWPLNGYGASVGRKAAARATNDATTQSEIVSATSSVFTIVTFLVNAAPSMSPIKRCVIETGSASWVPAHASREREVEAGKTPWGWGEHPVPHRPAEGVPPEDGNPDYGRGGR